MSKKDFFKIRLAIVFGYNGLGFQGLQKNPGANSIESELEKALFNAGLILSENFDNLKKLGWSRAARTDKGVHAIANYVSCKLNIGKNLLKDEPADEADAKSPKVAEENIAVEETKGEDEKKVEPAKSTLNKVEDKERIDKVKLINLLNSHLVDDIRVFAIKRVTQTFDAKLMARSRIYEYLAPMNLFHTKTYTLSAEEEQEVVEKVRGWCQKFKGTKNYHNYTRNMKATDPKAKRYIMDMQVELVKLEKYPDTPFLQFKIHGQSFIYHQIRKMIGILIQIAQEDEKEHFFDNSFFQNTQRIWLAPPQGLFLNRVTFEGYNNKTAIPELIEFDEEEEQRMEKFKREKIYELIYNSELVNKSFSEWLAVCKANKAEMLVESEGEGNDD